MKAAIGTYTQRTKSEGIYVIDIDPEKQVSRIVTSIPCINPSFLYFNRTASVLYAVQEVISADAALLAFSVSAEGTTFRQATNQPVHGSAPCHISLSPDGKLLIVSNYMSGNFVCYSINERGLPDRLQSNYRFDAKSIHPTRQKQSHIHSAFFTPDSRNVFIQDLGGDLIYQAEASKLYNDNTPLQTFRQEAGAGPRHICFLKHVPIVYVLNELQGTIDVCTLDQRSFIQAPVQKISLNPENADAGADLGAHIQLSSDDRFLYATNRGERNAISVYAVTPDYSLELIQNIPAGGKGPRFFASSPDDQWLFVTNQYTDSLNIFKRDFANGMLTPSAMQIEIPSPVCLSFL